MISFITKPNYDDPVNINYEFTTEIEAVQYNAASAITGCLGYAR